MISLAQVKHNLNNSKCSVNAIPTGIEAIDERTQYLCRGKLSILGARPGMGKTAIAAQIAQSLAKRGLFVLWFSTGNSLSQIASLFSVYDLPLNAQMNIWLEDRASEIRNVRNVIQRSEKKSDFIIVDSLQGLYRLSRKGNAINDYKECCAILQSLAGQVDAAILLLSGIKRTAEQRKGKMPHCEDIIGWEAIKHNIGTVCVFLHDGYYEDENDDKVNITFVFCPSVDRCCWVWAWWDRATSQVIPING